MAQLVRFTVVLVAALVTASCSTALFKVKPVTELPAIPQDARSADAGGVTVRVAPLLTDEESQELFEANLPLSGVLPIRLGLVLQSGLAIELKRARFHLRDGQNREWKLLSFKQVVSRIIKDNEVVAYNPDSRKQFEKDFGAYHLDLETPLVSTEPQREGFLFFKKPDKRPVETGQQLTLTVERLPQTATITIN